VIDAKLDQLNETIVINRGSQRLLADEQWVDIQSKLSAWKTSVRSLLGSVKAVRQEQAMLQHQMSTTANIYCILLPVYVTSCLFTTTWPSLLL